MYFLFVLANFTLNNFKSRVNRIFVVFAISDEETMGNAQNAILDDFLVLCDVELRVILYLLLIENTLITRRSSVVCVTGGMEENGRLSTLNF